MRAPVSWIRELVDLPDDVTSERLAARLTMLGLKLESLEAGGEGLAGPLVVGRVLSFVDEPQKNGKVVRWCRLDVGPEHNDPADDDARVPPGRGIVCGAHNFAVDDLVVVVLPGGVLPGGFEIAARKTYGHVSDGMICSTRELGLGEEHDGILVLPADAGEPGDDAIDLLGLRDDVIEMEINPDRAYALSLRGVARETALGFDLPFRDPADRDVPAVHDGGGHPVEVEDPEGCPLFVTRVVRDVDTTAPTPSWMVSRLEKAGMRSISLAVDVTNYVMLELGQPIHGYDGDKLSGPIRVRRARAGERLRTLDGVDRELHGQDLLITDDSGPIGLAGVMGGETTELSETSRTVVVEAAHFDPVSVFRTQKRHRLGSEASKRFERGVDPELPPVAAHRVVELLVQLGGGTAADGVTVTGAPPPRRRVAMPLDLPARVTGMPIDLDTTLAHLRAVGFAVEMDEAAGRVATEVPPWRPDVRDPFDLVEEVARVVGYDKVPSVLPAAPPGRGLTPAQGLRRRVGRALAGAGYVEVVSFPFVGVTDLDKLGLGEGDERRTTLRLANPLSAEEPSMTTTLLPGVLKAVARNASRGTVDVALFETATVTQPRGTVAAPILPVDRRPTEGEWDDLQKALPDQPLHLAVTVSGRREPAGWWGEGRPAGWADAVEAVRCVARAVGVEVSVRSAVRAPWHPGRCAEVLVGETSLGFAGELHPRVCRAYGVPERTAAAEVDLDLLLAHAPAILPAPTFSTFPVAKEDVALLVRSDVPSAEVAATLAEGAGELCEQVRLFDVYTGAQVPEGHTSLAFALRFRAPDRTLTEAETGAARDAAVALAAERHGATQR